jgi:chitodextrinase
MKLFMIAALLSLLTGCNRIPAIKAESIHYQSSYPIGGTTIDISNVDVTDTEVKAEKYTRKSRWWYVTQDVEIKGYSRQRAKGEKEILP